MPLSIFIFHSSRKRYAIAARVCTKPFFGRSIGEEVIGRDDGISRRAGSG